MIMVLRIVLIVALLGFVIAFAVSDHEPAKWLRWGSGVEVPEVTTAQAAALERMEEPPGYWAFYYADGKLAHEVQYERGAPFAFIPTRPTDWVEVYSNAPFSDLLVDWDNWAGLASGRLQVEFWRNNRWERFERDFVMGRVPAGPPEERGYAVGWGCYQWGKDLKAIPMYGALGYALRFGVEAELPEQAPRITIRSCMPEWERHPDYALAWIEHVDACQNLGGFGWSGKVIQTWVRDLAGRPLQGVEVRFGTETSYGVAWDRPDIGGYTSRFGLMEWDHYGVPTRYWICIEDFCVENVRVDLGNEYCYRDGRITSYRPPNRPGLHSWKLEIVKRQ